MHTVLQVYFDSNLSDKARQMQCICSGNTVESAEVSGNSVLISDSRWMPNKIFNSFVFSFVLQTKYFHQIDIMW